MRNRNKFSTFGLIFALSIELLIIKSKACQSAGGVRERPIKILSGKFKQYFVNKTIDFFFLKKVLPAACGPRATL